MLDGLSLLVPTIGEVLGLGRALLVGLAFWGCGRWALRASAPEIQTIAGWGAACCVLTFWGVLLPWSIALPGAAIVLAGLAGLILRPAKPSEWLAVGRVTLLAAPLLLLVAGTHPALLDSFTHWLPNAAYLVEHGTFPGNDRPPSLAFYPAFPYNLQLAAFLSALGAGQLPPGAVVHVNLVLQLAMALFLARLAAKLEDAPHAAPGWGACAIGLLACWWLNPGFGPEVTFSDYGDVTTGLALAVAGWLAVRLVSDADPQPLALALVLAALVNIKQADLVLVLALMISASVLAVVERRYAALRPLLAALLPALVLYGAWRCYVSADLAGGENELLPPAHWRFQELPAITGRIIHLWIEKIVYFGILFAAMLAGLVWWRQGAKTDGARLLVLLVGCFVLFDGFLLFIYVAHFQGAMSTNAQSYYRLNTELALLLVTGLVLALRDPVHCWLATLRWQCAAPALAVTVSLILPAGFFERVRFDLRRARSVPWSIAEAAARELAPGDHLAILGTGDNHGGTLSLRAYLGLLSPGVDASAFSTEGAEILPLLPSRGFDRVLVTCAGPAGPDLPPHSAALLAWDGARWQLRRAWPLATRPGKLFGERHPGELLGCD